MSILRSSAKAKGRSGEQEILAFLSNIAVEEYRACGQTAPELSRGPNGKDIVGFSWLAPEVKRHELAGPFQIKTWWEQCKTNAKSGATPVLFWRQNKEPWTVRMFGYLMLPDESRVRTPVDIRIDQFGIWFRHALRQRLHPIVKTA